MLFSAFIMRKYKGAKTKKNNIDENQCPAVEIIHSFIHPSNKYLLSARSLLGNKWMLPFDHSFVVTFSLCALIISFVFHFVFGKRKKELRMEGPHHPTITILPCAGVLGCFVAGNNGERKCKEITDMFSLLSSLPGPRMFSPLLRKWNWTLASWYQHLPVHLAGRRSGEGSTYTPGLRKLGDAACL